jgi:acetylglutamate kinase
MGEHRCCAETFAAALERMSAYRGKLTVVKLGGSAMEDPAATQTCLRSVAALHQLGVPIVLVHGGGKPIDRAMAEAGLIPRKVAGRRYTDDATLEIVVRVLKSLNEQLCQKLEALGVAATPYLEKSRFPLSGERLVLSGPDRRPIDLGHVGRVTHVREALLMGDTRGHVPVLPSLALDADGCWLNVNADTAASALAGALDAEKAIFLTDTPGVLLDRANPGSLVSTLTQARARDLIERGVIDGGMVPKVEACFEALEAGARTAIILDGRIHYALLDAFLLDTLPGTTITR